MPRLMRVEKRELIDKLVQALKIGNHIQVACDFAGVSAGTVSHWLRRGAREQLRADDEKIKMSWNKPRYRRSEVPYVKFSKEIQQALAYAEVRLATSVSKAADENWIAAMTMLERRYPERWSRMQRSEISGVGGGPVKVDLGMRRAAMEELEAEWEEVQKLPAAAEQVPLITATQELAQERMDGRTLSRESQGHTGGERQESRDAEGPDQAHEGHGPQGQSEEQGSQGRGQDSQEDPG